MLGANALLALGFLIAVLLVVVIANGVERSRVPQAAPAE